MPGDDSDFFDNVIEWKKVHNVRKKGLKKHTLCVILKLETRTKCIKVGGNDE